MRAPLAGALIPSKVDTETMQEFIRDVPRRLVKRAIGVMVLDNAGRHRSRRLRRPANLVPLCLPPYSRELNCVERLWLYLRQHHWSDRC